MNTKKEKTNSGSKEQTSLNGFHNLEKNLESIVKKGIDGLFAND
ncbi:hypothetical protein QMM44_13305 [Leptospira santarosai]|nr:hypothetical protein [Leptospira santarosai]MDI7204405.1 hypothetical protein [Leptospira santarosai]